MLARSVLAAALLTVLVAVPAGSAEGCRAVRVDDAHSLRATGTEVHVRVRDGGRKVIVLRGVPAAAVRHALDDGSTCTVGLERFEGHFRRVAYELHARVGRHAIRVRSVEYDGDRRVLRVRGRAERAAARQSDTSTIIIFASTFVPFDSSF
jgi:hypothetical protein